MDGFMGTIRPKENREVQKGAWSIMKIPLGLT